MKKIQCFYLLIFFIIISCERQSTSPNPVYDSNDNTGLMKISLDMTDAPPEVVRLAGKLSNNHNDVINFGLEIIGNIATALVENIPIGNWILKIDAYNDNDMIIYTGTTEVEIYSGVTIPVFIHLNPATGSLQITVTWGDVKFLDVQNEFSTNYSYVTGIAYDGNNLIISSGYHGDGGTEKLYKIDIYGQQIFFYELGFVPSQPYWENNTLWIQEEHTGLDNIVKLKYDSDTDDFTKELEFTPAIEAIDIEAMTYYNGSIWMIQDEGLNPVLYKLSATDGRVLSKFERDYFNDVDGLAHDGTYLWALNDTGKLIKIDTQNGNIVQTFVIAPVIESISNGSYRILYREDAGLAFDNHDQGLWVVWRTGRVMKVLLPKTN